MISKRALSRYIDGRIRAYLDINMFEVRALSSMMNEMKLCEERILALVSKEKGRSRREVYYDLIRMIIHKINPLIKGTTAALRGGDMRSADERLRQIIPLAFSLESSLKKAAFNENKTVWSADKFVSNALELVHSFKF